MKWKHISGEFMAYMLHNLHKGFLDFDEELSVSLDKKKT